MSSPINICFIHVWKFWMAAYPYIFPVVTAHLVLSGSLWPRLGPGSLAAGATLTEYLSGPKHPPKDPPKDHPDAVLDRITDLNVDGSPGIGLKVGCLRWRTTKSKAKGSIQEVLFGKDDNRSETIPLNGRLNLLSLSRDERCMISFWRTLSVYEFHSY